VRVYHSSGTGSELLIAPAHGLRVLCGQDEWKGQLDTIVKKVSDAFSQYYEEIGCKGTFNLDMSMLTLVA